MRKPAYWLLFLLVFPATFAQAQDWPQWRGPTRDGVAPAGPKLLNAWPTNGAGPKLVWQSDPIPSGPKGGAGSVTVAGGRAFLYVHARQTKGKVILSTKDLNDLGWMEGVPEDLVKKIDESIKSEKWRKLKPDTPAMETYIQEFTATLDPALATKYGDFIHNRMKQQPLSWNGLTIMARIRDKEVPAIEHLDSQVGISEHEAVYCDAFNVIKAKLNERSCAYLDTVICLDATTGKELWRKNFPGANTKQMAYWGASGTPAIWDGKCYVTGSAGFYCLRVKDGSVVWQARTRFSNSSPLIANGVVYCMVPELTAYDPKTGRVLWTNSIANTCGSVVPWSYGGTNYVIGQSESDRYGQLFCVNVETGRVMWTTYSSGSGATPFIVGDALLSRGGNGGGLIKFKLSPEKAEKVWGVNCDGDPGSPVVFQDCVYVTGGHCCPDQVLCLDWNTGQKKWTNWKEEVRCSSPVLADGKLFTAGKTCEIFMLQPSAEKYTELGHFNAHIAACTSPTIANGKLFVREDEAVACYDLVSP